jgi:glycosyltransferase involved in cell wall biosynthesis
LKILHIESGKNLYGGAQQVLFLLRNLSLLGVDSTLMCDSRSAIRKTCEQEGIPTYPIRIAGDLDLLLPFKIYRACKKIRPDLIHIHSRKGADYWGGWIANLLKIPCILSRRVDNPEPRWIVKSKYAMYDKVITISDGIRKVLISEGLEDEKIALVRSAVDFNSFPAPIPYEEFLKRFNFTESNLVIACAAQLIFRKGHSFLLDALPDILPSCREVKVLFFGKGSEEKRLKQQVAKMALDDVVFFPGFVEDIKSIYPHIDILVHPALMEGLGVALIEASFCGLPIVASRVGGIPEIVRDKETGFLVEPGDAFSICDALLDLLQNNELREKMGQNAQKYALDAFATMPTVRGNYEVYKSVLANRS